MLRIYAQVEFSTLFKGYCESRVRKGHDGDSEGGIYFAGRDAWKINEILSVKEIFKRFTEVFDK